MYHYHLKLTEKEHGYLNNAVGAAIYHAEQEMEKCVCEGNLDRARLCNTRIEEFQVVRKKLLVAEIITD